MNQTAPDIAPPGLAGCGRELAVAGADPASHRSRLSSCVGRARPACRAALLDAGYGANTDLRANITTLGLCAEHDGLGARHRAVAAEEMVGPRTTAEADPP